MSEEKYKISLTVKQMAYLEGTGIMQGTEEPETRAEMDATTRKDGSLQGAVSWSTLTWLMGCFELWVEVAAGDGDLGEQASARGALQKTLKVYEAAGGDARAFAPKEVEEAHQEDPQASGVVVPPAPPVPDPETPLADEEKDALGFAVRHNNIILRRVGIMLPTVRLLEKRGLVEVDVIGQRKWHAELTEAGKAVAGQYVNFILKPKVDGKKATSAVAVELFRDRPGHYMHEVGEAMDYSSLEKFINSVQGWVKDKSELSQAVIEAADYRELYIDFAEHTGATANLPPSKEEPEQAADRVVRPLLDLPGVVLPEDPEGAAMVVETVVQHMGLVVPPGTLVGDVPGLEKPKPRKKSRTAAPEASEGTPIRHTDTGEIVGYMVSGKFTPVSP